MLDIIEMRIYKLYNALLNYYLLNYIRINS